MLAELESKLCWKCHSLHLQQFFPGGVNRQISLYLCILVSFKTERIGCRLDGGTFGCGGKTMVDVVLAEQDAGS